MISSDHPCGLGFVQLSFNMKGCASPDRIHGFDPSGAAPIIA
jgi:hypothetical protein